MRGAVFGERRRGTQRHPAVYTGLGEHDRAFEWLERAFQERVPWVRRLDLDVRYAPVRGDARYANLQRRIRAAYLR
jgi:hypothetical protein